MMHVAELPEDAEWLQWFFAFFGGFRRPERSLRRA